MEALNEQDAKRSVISRYLSGFGPAAVEDIAWWIGIPKQEVKKILEGMGNDAVRIAIRGMEGDFYILPNEVEQLEKMPRRKDAVHLLPKFDPYMMGYKNRLRLISPKYEKKIYWGTRAEVSPAILVNGRIIGTWSHKEEHDAITLTLSLFEKTDKVRLREIRRNAESLARFIHGSDAVTVVQV